MIELRLDTTIYPISVIEHAIQDYASIAQIDVKSISSDYVECKFLFTKYDAVLTKKEFCNYLIDCMGSNIYGVD